MVFPPIFEVPEKQWGIPPAHLIICEIAYEPGFLAVRGCEFLCPLEGFFLRCWIEWVKPMELGVPAEIKLYGKG
jgi:hypothetical protein